MCAPNFKGTGVHWDIVLLCAINCLGSLIGGPWICAATVRAVSHVSALTVMSTNNAPGEPPKIVGVKDQRYVTFSRVFFSNIFFKNRLISRTLL